MFKCGERVLYHHTAAHWERVPGLKSIIPAVVHKEGKTKVRIVIYEDTTRYRPIMIKWVYRNQLEKV